jgi:hypothetical protein
MCFISGVQAQSSTTGTIYGSAVAPGSTVVIQNVDTGQTRQVTVGDNGRYTVTALPAGRYRVTLQKDGHDVATREDVNVQIGAGRDVSFAAAPAADTATLDRVVVTGVGASQIDVSAVDTRVVYTAEKLAKIPVARDINSVALLTPGVVAADSRYGNTASFGGSAASENAIYINGYAVTNPLTNLGSTTLPFDGIAQFQSIIGGYGAEFGRATGGVVNIVTKRGTNEWHAGGMALFSPRALREEQKSIYYPTVGRSTDGLLYQNLKEREVQSTTYGAYVSGPIFKDKLFFYASGEFTNTEVNTVGIRTASPATNYQMLDSDIPRWLGKLDWNITDNNLLEFTAIQDVTKRTDSYFPYSYSTLERGNTQNGGYYYEDGGKLYIAKYTGYLTDNLTLTALYGKQDQVHIATPAGYNASAVYVSDNRGVANPVSGLQPYLNLSDPNANDKTKGGRLDVEWRIGDHSVRVGYDRQESISTAGTAMSGPGYAWFYEHTNTPNDTIPSSGGAQGPGGNGDYVQRYIFANGGTFKVEQEAEYIEDRWQVSNNWLLSLGLRNEQFSNYNADGIVYASQRHQLAPRLGASWDVNGDSSFKVFGNIGRYHLAMPNNVALRGAAGSTYTREFFAFTGIDPTTGAPTGLTPLGNGPYSANNEFGQAPDPASVAAKGLKSHYQDEFIVGFEKQLGATMSYGTRLVYRNLKSAIDDTCDGRPAATWALANGYSAEVAENLSAALQNCRLFNPGEANTFLLDDGTGHLVEVPLTAEDLGYPKLKRSYLGADFFLERPFDGTWYFRVDYTLSKNYGNAEGQLNSDVGQGDVSQTLIWDHPELMVNSNGYLPNDRRHYLKTNGFYQFTPEWRVSAAFTAASGRPKTCHGFYGRPNTDVDGVEFYDNIEYGPYYHFCGNQASPRGTAGRLPWTTRLDLGVSYSPAFADNKLQFMLDVFNVFNQQEVQNVYELSESGAGFDEPTQKWVYTPNGSYGRVISYSAPRSIRFGVRYDF